jgi:hypothetical protein
MQTLITKVRDLLQGEPLRAIVYGAGVVIWLTISIANALGVTRFGPEISVEDALTQATAASVLLTEIARRFTYSTNTVERVAAQAAATGSPTVTIPPP